MTDFRKLARNRECQIRVPSHCSGDLSKVVLCHYRLVGLSGMGIKSPDWCAAYGCFNCHQIVDGQKGSEYTVAERKLMLAEGVFRTQKILIDEGKLTW